MKTNKPLPEKENKPNIVRKTVTVGEPEKKEVKQKSYSSLLVLLIVITLFGSALFHNVDWHLVKNVPTIQDKPHFFKSIKSKQYFKSVTVPTPIPVPVEAIEEKKDEVVIEQKQDKIEIKHAKKQNISYSNLPNYHTYDSLIIKESKKYRKVKPVVIKAIIEQESLYNTLRQKYEEKWERDYGSLIPKKRGENLEEWQMNFRSYGLMQISYVLHKDFCELNSYMDLLKPEINIACGVKLYNACIEDGNSESFCIKKHNGSGPSAEKYKNEVLSRVARIMSVPTKLMS